MIVASIWVWFGIGDEKSLRGIGRKFVSNSEGSFNTLFRASERCHQEKRKTINGEDILFAMSTLGFDSYVEPLKQYLQKYREVSVHQCFIRTSYR